MEIYPQDLAAITFNFLRLADSHCTGYLNFDLFLACKICQILTYRRICVLLYFLNTFFWKNYEIIKNRKLPHNFLRSKSFRIKWDWIPYSVFDKVHIYPWFCNAWCQSSEVWLTCQEMLPHCNWSQRPRPVGDPLELALFWPACFDDSIWTLECL